MFRSSMLWGAVCSASSEDIFLDRRLAGAGSVFGGPPEQPLDYSGRALPPMTIHGAETTHIFAIGDWGGMDGTLWTNAWPPNGRNRLIVYDGGAKGGPSVFPRTRLNYDHSVLLCSHKDLITCFNTRGAAPCDPGCGFVDGVDTEPQMLVAEQFRHYAAKLKPKLILNVGDNLYWGGVELDCGSPMSQLAYETRHQFEQVFEGIYSGPGLDNVPWLSVLGNHDWGGRVFNNGWDQQIAYTWASNRWLMPAPYFSQRVNYPDQGFSIDIILIDSNAMDAKDPEEDPEHNLCSAQHNLLQGTDKRNANCTSAGGPEDVTSCKKWFWDFWRKNQEWAEGQLQKSTADWQIIVTHFPCGHEAAWYRKLHGMGLDLLVTGHRHDQELWDATHPRHLELGGLICFVTGGGGGITSEATPVVPDENWYGEAQYGFYDLAVTKSVITITSITYNGTLAKTAKVFPH